MARKKKQEEAGAGSPWLTTFADLMNLLLCFFVLLFASSTVDAAKYEDIVISMSSAFGIFSGGGSDNGEGRLISSGISRIHDYDGYENNDGTNAVKTETNNSAESDILKELLEENKKASQVIYDKVSELANQNSLSEYIDLSMDPGYRYVKISLSGSVLFDSGKADIKPGAIAIFSKLGDILQVYKDYHIEIEGHTDNVPVNSSNTYKDNNWLSSARAINVAVYLMDKKGLNPKTLSWTGRGEYDPVASNATTEGRAKNRRVEIKIHNNINN